MTEPTHRPPARLPDSWDANTLRGARFLGLGVACLLAGYLGALALPLAPWSLLALPAGLGLAAALRWGTEGLVAAALGMLLAALSVAIPAPQALGFTLIASLALWLACRVLTRLGFDARFERARDVAWFVVVTAGLAAGITALGVELLQRGLAHAGTALFSLGSAASGWWLVALGMLLSGLPALTADRRLLASLHGRAGASVTLTLGLAAVGSAGLAGALSALEHQALLPLLFVTPVLLVALVARAGVGFAAMALLVAATAYAGWAGTRGEGLLGWNGNAADQMAPAAWLSTMIASVLIVHGAAAEAAWRSQRWEWALDGSRLGVAEWHVSRADSFASAAWHTLIGQAPGRWSPALWLAQVHVEDRAALEDAIGQLAAGQAGRLQLELRMPWEESWRWFEATLLVAEREADGRAARLLATLADVDERHDAQERQRLSVSLFQHLHEGLLITDAELRALDANPAYTEILGVPRTELVGSVPTLLRPSSADPIARQQRTAMWAGVRETGSWRGELMEMRRSGEMCTLRATISTVLGPSRDVRYHVLVISDITEQRVQRERLERQAHFDELTRLPNRALLSQLLADAMRAADRDACLLTVCYLDLDRFKPVNDRYGHAAGDRLLAELAGRLRSALRSRDTWADCAARLGGDEFVLLLRADTIEEARLAVERVLRVVSQPYVIDAAQDPVQVTASMGATVYPLDGSDADTLLRHADHAMYGAKQSGRNGYLFFDPEHRRRTEERVMAIGRVQEALDQSEFLLHYQPKVDMRSGKVLGFEALLRWDHPQQGLVAPLQFLPLIENTGLSARVGDWVFSQALEHLSQWRRNGLDISVSVNVSARHLQEPDFALRLSELLARHAEPLAPFLELEMLETAAHADIEATSALLARCRALGVRFALDDFGTGYSTLTYLKRLPVDVLKIDRSFVHHMLDDQQDRAIVEGVIGLARTFGCTVVAEGVESPAQARTLLELGCDTGQGTGIAAPMPASQVAGWVRDYRGMFALAPAEAAAATAPVVKGSRP